MALFRIQECDLKAERLVRDWLSEAGGKMELDDLRFRYQKHFNCEPNIYTEEELAKLPPLAGLTIKDGIVYLPEAEMVH